METWSERTTTSLAEVVKANTFSHWCKPTTDHHMGVSTRVTAESF